MPRCVCPMLLCAFGVLAAPAQDLNDHFYDAIRNDDTPALKRLIGSAAGFNTNDKRGTTPLMYAAAVGSLHSMEMLLDAGADVNTTNGFGVTALMWCATDEAKVRLLLSKGADANARSKQGRTPLLIAASTEGSSSILKLLLDKGAKLKDADATPVATPLAAAAFADDTAAVRLLLEHGAEFRGPAGGVALMNAAGHGNVETMQLLLSRGVPADIASPPTLAAPVKNGAIKIGSLTPLLLAVSYGGPDAVKLLLDLKANVNAQDVRGMTPLMLALAVDHADPRVVRLLLERGADPNTKSKAGETAIDWARKFNHPEILRALNVSAVPVKASYTTDPLPIRDSVQKSADLLQRTNAKFFTEGACASCHAHNMTSMALSTARTAGIHTDQSADAERAQQTKAFWSPQQQALMLRIDAPGTHNMTSYGVLGLAGDGAKADGTTDAMVHNLAAQQRLNGSWHDDGLARPPMADGDFTHTAIAVRSLSLYGPAGRKPEFATRISRAVVWLRAGTPVTAEDHNMQLLGMTWGGADRNTLDRAWRKILSMQRADGGWTQTPYLASDAYATGQTLAALKQAGLPPSDPAYRKGADFLLRTQLADGSWHVSSRAPKFQPYFQSGFPHDHDQWISMAATSWATMALAYALPQSEALALK